MTAPKKQIKRIQTKLDDGAKILVLEAVTPDAMEELIEEAERSGWELAHVHGGDTRQLLIFRRATVFMGRPEQQ